MDSNPSDDNRSDELQVIFITGQVPVDTEANGCGRFAAGMMTMVVATVTLVLTHARGVALPWLALLPLGVGILLLLYFQFIGLWKWR